MVPCQSISHDGTTNEITKVVTIGNNPMEIVVNESTNKVYVINSGDKTISVIDENTVATKLLKNLNPI